MKTIHANSFLHIPGINWGFQPLQALSHSLDAQGNRLGVLYKTYINDPKFNPGRPIWVYAIDEVGGWAATSELSETDLETKVLKILHPKKPERTKPCQ